MVGRLHRGRASTSSSTPSPSIPGRPDGRARIVGEALFGEEDYRDALRDKRSGSASPTGSRSAASGPTCAPSWTSSTCSCTPRSTPSPSGRSSSREWRPDSRWWRPTPAGRPRSSPAETTGSSYLRATSTRSPPHCACSRPTPNYGPRSDDRPASAEQYRTGRRAALHRALRRGPRRPRILMSYGHASRWSTTTSPNSGVPSAWRSSSRAHSPVRRCTRRCTPPSSRTRSSATSTCAPPSRPTATRPPSPPGAFPFLAPAFSAMHVDADVVVCSSSGWAHGVRTAAPKVVYCHAVARWLSHPSGTSARTSARLVARRGSPWRRPAPAMGRARRAHRDAIPRQLCRHTHPSHTTASRPPSSIHRSPSSTCPHVRCPG